MKVLSFLIVNILLVGSFLSCSGQDKKNDQKNEAVGKIDVYYFHFTRRCATCNAVEDEAKKAIEENYSKQFKNGEITFASVNLDEDAGKKVGEKVGISGQALLIVKGDKKKDLTNEGFMSARTNPEKFHKVIKKEIDGLL